MGISQISEAKFAKSRLPISIAYGYNKQKYMFLLKLFARREVASKRGYKLHIKIGGNGNETKKTYF